MVEAALIPEVQSPVTVGLDAIPERLRPKLRGIPDVVATLVAIPAVLMLIGHANGDVATLGASVYGLALVLLFAVSATYHTFTWPFATRMLLRRFDHSMVYVLIAGSYTPMCLMALPPETCNVFLAVTWGITLLGIIKSFVWTSAPRVLNTAIYVAAGWVLIPKFGLIYEGIGFAGAVLLGVGGLMYTFGAFIYMRRWPNPSPKIFGYHEVFHLFVMAAGACHYALMWNLLG